MLSNFYLERLGICYSIRLNFGENSIGRFSTCAIVIDSTYCSRLHCTITVVGNRIMISDSSSNGTYIDDVQIVKEIRVIDADSKIGIGVSVNENELANDGNLFVFILRRIEFISIPFPSNNLQCIPSFLQKPAPKIVEIIDLIDVDSDDDEIEFSIPNNIDEEINLLSQTIEDEIKLNAYRKKISDNMEIDSHDKFKNFPEIIDINEDTDDLIVEIKNDDNKNEVIPKIENDVTKNESIFEIKNELITESNKNNENDTIQQSKTLVGRTSLRLANKDNTLNNFSNNEEIEDDVTMNEVILDIKDDANKNEVIPDIENDVTKNEIILQTKADANKIENIFEVKNNGNKDELITESNKVNENNTIPHSKTLRQRRKSILLAVSIFGTGIVEDMSKDEQYKNIIDPAIKIERNSLTEVIEEINANKDNTLNDLNNDEDFLQSQCYLGAIKEEINDYDCNDIISQSYISLDNSNKDVDDVFSPLVIEISDDETELDWEAKSWMVKLSQNIKEDKNTKDASSNKRKLDDYISTVKKKKPSTTKEIHISNVNLVKKKKPSTTKEIHISNVNLETLKKNSRKLTKIETFSTPLKRKRCVQTNKDNPEVLKNAIARIKPKIIERKRTIFYDETPRILNRPAKLRFSKIPKSAASISNLNLLKSCLKSTDKVEKKIKKCVRFNENIQTKTYDSYEIHKNLQKIGKSKDAALPAEKIRNNYEPRHNIINKQFGKEMILTEILSWNYKSLLEHRNNINGMNSLRPMMHNYESFDSYKSIVFPLMKLELWVRLEQDNNRLRADFIFNHFDQETRNGIKQRILYYCEFNSDKRLFFEADLVVLDISDDMKIFGFIRTVRFIDRNHRKYFELVIETNWSQELYDKIKMLRNYTKYLKIIKLSEIRIEVGAFEAVNSIKFSPLLPVILKPNLLKIPKMNISKIKYTGYHKLNSNQEQVLLNTYMACINANTPTIQLIEGPPGTGKSLLIVNLILQIMYGNESRNQKRVFLICAHSNVAIDVILTKLINIRTKMENHKRFNLLRFGNIEKMCPNVRKYSLPALIEHNRNLRQQHNGPDFKNEETFLINRIEDLKKNNSNGFNNNNIDKYSSELRCLQEIDRRKEKGILLQNARIICTTVSSCVNLRNFINRFDVCIIDEATQCNEPWSLLPVEFGINSLILVGDTNQLPATCISPLAKDYNYGKSLFTRIKETLDVNVKIPILRTQYRMHPEILHFPNRYFYSNSLKSSMDIAYDIKLLPYSILNLNYGQNQNAFNDISSISNFMEAKFVIKLIECLTKIMDLDNNSYGVITPYSLHRDDLYKKLSESGIENFDRIEVNTIDAFQGKEKDIIIISNARTEGVGFLKDPTRLNVALTRAKKCLILCGNFQQLEKIPVWKALLKNARKRNLFYDLPPDVLNDFEQNVMPMLKINQINQ